MSNTPEEFLNEIREMDRIVWKMIERANKMKLAISRIQLETMIDECGGISDEEKKSMKKLVPNMSETGIHVTSRKIEAIKQAK